MADHQPPSRIGPVSSDYILGAQAVAAISAFRSMNVFIFDNVTYSRLYDCSSKTTEEWARTGSENPIAGLYLMSTGVVFMLPYIPCLYGIIHARLYTNNCYKIMIRIMALDIETIFMNSCFTGYLSYIGAVFCTHPTLIYVTGTYGLGLWVSNCLCCMVLAINRVADVTQNAFMKSLFAGRWIYCWLILTPFYHFLFMFYTPAALFNSLHNSWFFDPYNGYDFPYANYAHLANNVVDAVSLNTIYAYLIYRVAKQAKIASGNRFKYQKAVLIQSACICLFNSVPAAGYVAMNFMNLPPVCVFGAHVGWQASNACCPILYMTLNPTVRNEVRHMVYRVIGKGTRSSQPAATMQHRNSTAMETRRNVFPDNRISATNKY